MTDIISNANLRFNVAIVASEVAIRCGDVVGALCYAWDAWDAAVLLKDPARLGAAGAIMAGVVEIGRAIDTTGTETGGAA